jgi:hypothetical protein
LRRQTDYYPEVIRQLRIIEPEPKGNAAWNDNQGSGGGKGPDPGGYQIDY